MKYDHLQASVNEDIFARMEREFPEMLETWDEECKNYNSMTDEEVGACGENLSPFQTAVFGSSEPIEEFLNDLAI